MADGLIKRYRDARDLPPQIIYTDGDCSSDMGLSKYGVLFEERGEELKVSLDICALHVEEIKWYKDTSRIQ